MKPYLILGLSFLVCNLIKGQNQDAGIWTSLTAEKKITQSFSAGLSETFRFNENASELGTYFTELGIDKKFIKRLNFGLGYRFANKRELNDKYSSRHRYFFDISYKIKAGDFSVTIRTRIQTQIENYFLPDEKYQKNIPENYWRNKFSLSYNKSKKYKPFISGEIWHLVKNRDKDLFDNLRFSSGIKYEINKKNSLEIYCIYQKELQKNNPKTDYISSLNYTFAF